MAGAKGRSGGVREGAGRKPAPPKRTKAKAYQTQDPDEFLRAVMADSGADFKDRMAAALALKKSGSAGRGPGKKEQSQAAALAATRRSLAPTAPPSRPKLVAVK